MESAHDVPERIEPEGGAVDLSVVIPVYRNAETVGPLAHRLERVLEAERLSYEIVFVNDACPASLEALRELSASEPRVVVVPLEKNVGQHRAVLAGLARARGRAVATMDADLQDPPEALPAMLRSMESGYAAVFAGRRGAYESEARLMTSRLFKALLHRLSGVPADAGMFVVMTRQMVASLLARRETRPFVVAMIGASGLPLFSIPVERAPRFGGTSAYSSWMRLSTGCCALFGALPMKWRDRRSCLREPASNHNEFQRAYFEGSVKRTMVPADSRYLRRQADELLRLAAVRSDERVLEVGCGMGRYTLLLARRGIRVEGLDLSPVLLDRLRAYGGGRPPVPLHCGDIEDPPAALLGCFDVVLGFFVLHHVKDLAKSFDGMVRLLKPGGRVVFLEPNPYNPLFYIQILATPGMTWRGDGGIVRMRRAVIFDALTRAGFSQPRMRRFGFFPPFLANARFGGRVESGLERFWLWRSLLPFQLFRAERS